MEPIVLTFSSMKDFNNCEELWRLKHIERLRPMEEEYSEAREAGTDFHHAMGVLLTEGLGSALDACPPTNVRAVKVRALLQLAEASGLYPFKPVTVEANIGPVTIPGIRGFRVAGRVDATDAEWLWEYKTVTDFSATMPLQYDMQGLLYLWILQRMGKQLRGMRVVSFRRSPLKGKQNESLAELEDRIVRIAMDAPDMWMRMEEHEPAPSEMKWVEQQVRRTIAKVRWAMSKRGHFGRNMPSGCFQYNRSCIYRPICWALEQEREGITEVMFTSREDHPELVEKEVLPF